MKINYKETYKLLLSIASQYKVPEKEVHVRIGETGFLEFWQFIETGMQKNDQWKLLGIKKINLHHILKKTKQ